jgi:hypothetical protein
MATLTIADQDLMKLVVCAYVAAEIESAFDLSDLEAMPSPFPEMLATVRERHEHWMSLDFPYDVYPDGWEESLLAPVVVVLGAHSPS